MVCIHGYFKKMHQKGPEYPFVKAILVARGDELGYVEFLVDTGGGLTVLSHMDAVRLGIYQDIDRKKCIDAIGIGIERECALKYEVSILLVDSVDESKRYRIPVDEPGLLVAPAPVTKRRGAERWIYQRPSILGWNALKYVRILVDYRKKLVQLCLEEP